MRHNDAQESLADGIDLAPLPPMGADGQPQLAPKQDMPLEPPRLCEAGPCRHYHTFKIQLDAQNPMNTDAHGHVFHTERHHYCYPNTGVETNLGSLPVLECNRWVPVGLFRIKSMVKRRYERELKDFARAQASAVGEISIDEAATFDVEVAIRIGASDEIVQLAIDPHDPITNVVLSALEKLGHDRSIDGSGDPVGFSYTLADESGPIDNLSTTIAQLGLQPGARLIVNLSPKDPAK